MEFAASMMSISPLAAHPPYSLPEGSIHIAGHCPAPGVTLNRVCILMVSISLYGAFLGLTSNLSLVRNLAEEILIESQRDIHAGSVTRHLSLQYDLKDSRAAGSLASFIERMTSLPSVTKAFLSRFV